MITSGMNELTLNDIPKNGVARVKSIDAGGLSNRLLEMGFYPNQKIQVVSVAPVGDPIAVQVGNSMVLLRRSEASGIVVESIT